MITLLITITVALAVILVYSLVVLKSLREELKAKNRLIRVYKQHMGVFDNEI